LEICFIVSFFAFLFSSLSIVTVYIAVLAHAVGVEFLVRAVPRLFVTAVLVVAVTTHSLCVVLLLRMPTVISLLTELHKTIHFLL
jgi:hypothetical protein